MAGNYRRPFIPLEIANGRKPSGNLRLGRNLPIGNLNLAKVPGESFPTYPALHSSCQTLEAEACAQTVATGISEIGPGADDRTTASTAADTGFDPAPGSLFVAIEEA